jgi:hypothetical protein
MCIPRGFARDDEQTARARRRRAVQCTAHRRALGTHRIAAPAPRPRAHHAPARAEAAPSPSPRREREERREFERQWFTRGDAQRRAIDPRQQRERVGLARFERVRVLDDERLARLLEQIDRDVAVGGEEADATQALDRDAARGQIRDATVLELETGVGDVLGARQHRDTDRRQVRRRLTGQVQDGIDVVDHEVADDVDVERTRLERRHAVGLDELRRCT